jgi:hypothetical protein
VEIGCNGIEPLHRFNAKEDPEYVFIWDTDLGHVLCVVAKVFRSATFQCDEWNVSDMLGKILLGKWRQMASLDSDSIVPTIT